MYNDGIKPSILIVDDAPENLDILKMALMDTYSVRPALNGTLALRLAAMEPQPDLILLDIMMPGMDGYEVCRQLKRNVQTQDIPVIFVTAKSDDKDEMDGLQMGAVDYMTKPLNPAIVKARVRTHLTLRRFGREIEEKNRHIYEINERLTAGTEQLSASEDRFRGLVQTIPDIVYKIDSEGRFTFLNRSIERLGYYQSELIGKHFSAIIHSADVQDASLEKVLARLGKGGGNPGQKLFDERRSGARMTVGLEIRLRPKTGQSEEIYELKNIDHSLVNVEVNSTGLYGEVGQARAGRTRQYIGTVGIIRDVTDRQKAQNAFMEERTLLRELIDIVPLPIFSVDVQGGLLFSNGAFQQFVGMEGDALEGVPLEDLLCVAGQSGQPLLWQNLLDTPGVESMDRELTVRLPQGQEQVVRLKTCRFYRSSQAVATVVGVLIAGAEPQAFTRIAVPREQAEDGENGQAVSTDSLPLPLPPIPGVDMVQGLRSMGGDRALYRAVLGKFVRNQGGAGQLLERAMAAGNIPLLERTAHSLKGVAATIGAMQLADLAGRVEKLSVIPEAQAALPELLQRTTGLLEGLVHAIGTLLVTAEDSSPTEQPGEGGDASERLVSLMRRAAQLLRNFDSAAENVVQEMVPLACTAPRRERIQAIREALDRYDFEQGLAVLQAWAEAEGVVWEVDPS